MSVYVIESPAVAQAVGLCWMARQRGLPEVVAIRGAVAQLHPEGGCGWCAYPLDELMRMLRGRNVSAFADKAWWGMPGQARLRALAAAQGADDQEAGRD